MKKILFSLLLASLFSSTASADCGAGGHTCTDVKLDMIYVTSGLTLVQTDGDESLLTNCTSPDGKHVKLSHSHASAEQIYALLLTAYTGKLNVRLRMTDTSGGTGDCYISYAILEKN